MTRTFPLPIEKPVWEGEVQKFKIHGARCPRDADATARRGLAERRNEPWARCKASRQRRRVEEPWFPITEIRDRTHRPGSRREWMMPARRLSGRRYSGATAESRNGPLLPREARS